MNKITMKTVMTVGKIVLAGVAGAASAYSEFKAAKELNKMKGDIVELTKAMSELKKGNN